MDEGKIGEILSVRRLDGVNNDIGEDFTVVEDLSIARLNGGDDIADPILGRVVLDEKDGVPPQDGLQTPT